MKVIVEDINPTRKKLRVTILGQEITEAENKLLADIVRKGSVPGFRAGKAPMPVLRKRYAKFIEEELRNDLMRQAYQTIQNESELNNLEVIDLEEGSFVTGQDSEVTFTVDTVPDFDLPDYKQLNLADQTVTVSPEEIEEGMERMRKEQASYEPVDRAAETGDYVKLSYEGKIGSESIADLVPDKPIWGTRNNTWEEAGKLQQGFGVPAVVDALVGMQANDEKTVDMEFAKDFELPALAAKTGTYSISVHEVRECRLPEWDEIIKKMEVEDQEALRSKTEQLIKESKQEEQRKAQIESVKQQLIDKVDIQLPENMLQRRTQALFEEQLNKQFKQGVSEETLQSQQDKLLKQAEEEASKRLALTLVVNRIADKESVKIEGQEMEHYIRLEAYMRGMKVDKVMKDLKKDQGRLQQIHEFLKIDKTLNLIIEWNKFKEDSPKKDN